MVNIAHEIEEYYDVYDYY